MTGSSGQTNIITYAHGMRQRLIGSHTNSIFALDDVQPEKIPSGARLQLSFAGKHPALLYLSTNLPDSALMTKLNGGDVVNCVWTNGNWRKIEDGGK